MNRTYTCGEKCFIQFCLKNRLTTPTGDILPASERALVSFASYLAWTVCHGTIKTYLAAVCNLCIISGYKDPLRAQLLLKKILRGILCYQRSPRIWRQPVTPGALLAICSLFLSWLGPRDFSMIWAAFRRCSKFTHSGVHSFSSKFSLTKECVTFCPCLACPQGLLVALKSSKTDSSRAGPIPHHCLSSFFVVPCLTNATMFSPSQTMFGAIVTFPVGLLPHPVLCHTLTSGFCKKPRALRVTVFI